MHIPSTRRARRIGSISLVTVAAVASLVTALVTPGALHAETAVAPSSTVDPKITGETVKGKTLAATSGTWSGTAPFTFAYEWLRCDTSGGNCVATSGTSSTHTLVTGDVGKRMRVRVTATNADGEATALS